MRRKLIGTIRIKRGASDVLTSRNPTLAQGEPALDTTNKALKIGDGQKAWNDLPVLISEADRVKVAAMPEPDSVVTTDTVQKIEAAKSYNASQGFWTVGGVCTANIINASNESDCNIRYRYATQDANGNWLSNYQANVFTIKKGGSGSGVDVMINPGNNVFIGSGESASNLYSSLGFTGAYGVPSGYSPEALYLTSDTNIYFFSYCDGDGANRKLMRYGTDGVLYYYNSTYWGSGGGGNLICYGNEFNFAEGYKNGSGDTAGEIYINYRNSKISKYKFGNGRSGGLAEIQAGAVYDGDHRVYSANNPPPDASSTALGAVYGSTTTSNTAIGYVSSCGPQGGGGSVTSSVAIGNTAKVISNNTTVYSNSIAIGSGATVTNASNRIQLGNSSISSFNCKVSLTVTSDERDKTDIAEVDGQKALDLLGLIEPVTYADNDRHEYLLREKTDSGEYDRNGENEKLYESYDMCEYDREAHARGEKKGERRRVGVKAQQVVTALLEVYGTDNYANIVNDNFYDLRESGDEPPVENQLSVAYERFVPFLIAAVKEQQKQISALQMRICELEA